MRQHRIACWALVTLFVLACSSEQLVDPISDTPNFLPAGAGTHDFGDAPNGAYPTRLASNGARHVLGSGLFLGAAVDGEPDGQPTGQPSGAAGDDQNGATPDDEDGVTFTSALVPGAATTLDVVASAAGVLNAWIDFNFNGVWENSERIFTNVALTPGTNSLSFAVPASTLIGNKFARFRVNSTGGLSPSGEADDGEVEDYQVTVGELDFGDAPNGAYPTRLASNGARHVLGSGLFLGTAVDGELDGQPNGGLTGATGDDLLGGTPDDEDGVVFTSPLVPGESATVDVVASEAGKLNAWIDFNFNGVWQASERILSDVPLVAGTNNLTFAVPADAKVRATFARFRVNTAGGLAPTGLAGDGEVEDYRLIVREFDYGDAPGVYPTKRAQDGARHVLSSSLFLGAAVDGEADGQPNGLTATGDDLAGSPDEDGVTFTSAVYPGVSATVDVVASGTGLLNAWIDFNKNGVWESPSEQIFTDVALAAGVNDLTFAVPGNATLGNTFARFRVNAAGGLSPSGTAWDGEVEDYAVNGAITGSVVPCTNGKAAALFECSGIDLLSYLPIGGMGGGFGVNVNDVWGWTDPVGGKEYAVVGRVNGIAFVDVSDPVNPIFVGQLPQTLGSPARIWRDVKVYADHAFIVADASGNHGMQVFDLRELRGYNGIPTTFAETTRYTGIASAHNIVINEATGFAYAVGSNGGNQTCGGGLHMIDIQDPQSPVFAGCFADALTGRSGTGYTHDAMCIQYDGPDQDYLGREICFGLNETALSIADVSDKNNPVAVSRASYPNVAYAHQGWVTDDRRYLYSNDELDEWQGGVNLSRTLIWDIADLDDPVLAAEHFGPNLAIDHNLYVRGTRLYQSNYQFGIRVLDISDPVNPSELGFFDTAPASPNSPGFDGSWSNYPFFDSGIIVVTSGDEGLFVLKFAN